MPSPNRHLLLRVLSVAGIVPQPAHFERLHVDSVQKPPPDGIARRLSPPAIGEEEQTKGEMQHHASRSGSIETKHDHSRDIQSQR